MKTHILKIEARWLDRLITGQKTCEIRKNDRDFQVGDKIDFEPIGTDVCFAPQHHQITHVLHSVEGLQDGYVVLSIKKI